MEHKCEIDPPMLRTKRVGHFTQKTGGEEAWEEPEVDDVEDHVWTDIRERGFGGRRVKHRELKRIWMETHDSSESVPP